MLRTMVIAVLIALSQSSMIDERDIRIHNLQTLGRFTRDY